MATTEFKDNYWGLWLVVKPTVGIPLFFIAIVVTALLVHAAILTHTTWFGAYWQGHAKTVAENVVPMPGAPAMPALASR